MAKISKTWHTREEVWYDEMKSIAPYIERQYEDIILAHIKTLFPDYFAINYKRTVRPPGSNSGSDPDFALIRHNYAEWWIVEVETIGDTLKHVSKQIKDFTEGDYNKYEVAKYIYNKDNSLDFDKLLRLVQGENPKVLILVDDYNSEWKAELEQYTPKPSVCIFKVFRANTSFELLSISGDYPYILEDQSFCHWADPFPGLMRLVNPDVLAPQMKKEESGDDSEPIIEKPDESVEEVKNLEADSDDTIWVSYRGKKSEYKRIDIPNLGVFIQPVGTWVLRPNSQYLLKRTTRYGYIIDLV